MKNNIIVGRNLLETLTSALYESPIILFREYVQNSLDAYNRATKKDNKPVLPDFQVTIKIDRANRRIVIRDNGYGISSTDSFIKDMLRFGDSDKTDRTQFIGFRGIGRMAALPFCKALTFRNKPENSNQINICIWAGETYKTLLNDNSTDISTFQDMVRNIVTIQSEPCDKESSHYFEVIIDEYGLEVEETIENHNFEQSLRKLLPIKYSDDFKAAKEIEAKYKEFMNEDISDYMCSVALNDIELRKNYCDTNHVLDSGIIFWPVREKSSGKEKPGDKIGLLWFTFNRKIESSKIKGDADYGIMIRSKNVLMGDNDTFADLCASSKEYVGTYSELTATLRGVYGEFLINSPNLKDNARREWFKTDEYSIYLKYVIVDFMQRLYKYRYAASSYYRQKTDEKAEQKKSLLKKSLVELVDVETNKIDISDFYKIEFSEKKQDSEQNNNKSYSSEDMPRLSQTKRKNYDELMVVIEDFFLKEKQYEIFFKLRAYIKSIFGS